jgi:hypothetical protein
MLIPMIAIIKTDTSRQILRPLTWHPIRNSVEGMPGESKPAILSRSLYF